MPHRYIIRRFRRWFIYRVLHVDDTPHRIAMGIAVGIFVAWTPTIGLQMILCVLISALVGANKFVGLPFVWLSNPLTVIPIYGPNYMVGNWLLGGKYSWPSFMEDARAMMFQGEGNILLRTVARIQSWWAATVEVFLPLWLGSLLVAAVLAVGTYFTIARIVTIYRQRQGLRRRILAERATR